MSARILRVAERDRKVFDYLVFLMFGEAGVDPRIVSRILRMGLWDILVGGGKRHRAAASVNF
ncbi:MAG: hypothetical protein WEF28_13600 [Acidimicrobiia bacterium]